jgi:predicted nucleic-acid-binding protein
MRKAISRNPVFEAFAGDDVEVLVPQDRLQALSKIQGPNPLSQGAVIYCSASNAVRRRFPTPSFRPSETTPTRTLDVKVTINADSISAEAQGVSALKEVSLEKAAHPERTYDAVKKAFSRMGDAGWRLGALEVTDDDKLFAPPSVLNDLRRMLTEKISENREDERKKKIQTIIKTLEKPDSENREECEEPLHNIKLRLSQTLQDDEKYFDEIIFAIGRATAQETINKISSFEIKHQDKIRLALPVFTQEKDFADMRRAVKQLSKAGFKKWEASDLATLRLLKNCGIDDLTADWTFYAFNSKAAEVLAELGIKRAVASPENNHGNLEELSRLKLPFEFLDEQSTPLFISLTKPMAKDPSELTGLKGDKFTSFEMDGLWITTRLEPTPFSPPSGAKAIRSDISWNP